MHKTAHDFPCPPKATPEPKTHGKDAVSFSWQLFDTWCMVVRSLGKAYTMIWKMMPTAALYILCHLTRQLAALACWSMRLPIVSNFFTNFWIHHFDDVNLPQNLFWNAICDSLNDPVCQYVQTRNTLSSN
jgi:hypothetical protein